MVKKMIIERSHIERKSFHFSKGNVILDFQLRIDIMQEMMDWIELLDAARADVLSILNDM